MNSRLISDTRCAACASGLTNPIFWFELSIPTPTTEMPWRTVAAKVETATAKFMHSENHRYIYVLERL